MPRRAVRIDDAVDAYLKDMKAMERSPGTIKSYRSVLEGLTAFTGNVWMAGLQPTQVRDYFRSLSDPDRKPKPVGADAHNRYIGYVTAFAKWCYLEGYLTEGTYQKPAVMSRTTDRKTEEKDKLWLTAEQAVSLIEQTDDVMHRAFVTVALDTASRGGEMARMTIGDLDLAAGTLRKTITKSRMYSRRVDVFALSPDSDRILRTWLAEYARLMNLTLPQLVAREDWLLFPRRRNRPIRSKAGYATRFIYYPEMPISTPFRIVRDGLLRLGYTEEELKNVGGVHCTRRSAVRLAREATGDIRVAQQMAGHSSQKTTEIYLGYDVDREARNQMLKAGAWRRPAPVPSNVVPLVQARGE